MKALSEILYSTYSCRPERVVALMEADMFSLVGLSSIPKVVNGSYSSSDVTITPFCSIGGTSSHDTKMEEVGEVTNSMAETLTGDLVGTRG